MWPVWALWSVPAVRQLFGQVIHKDDGGNPEKAGAYKEHPYPLVSRCHLGVGTSKNHNHIRGLPPLQIGTLLPETHMRT